MKLIPTLQRLNIFATSEFRNWLNDLASAVNELMGRVESGNQERPPDEWGSRALRGIPVELTALDPDNKWEFKEKYWSHGDETWKDHPDGLTHVELGPARPVTQGPENFIRHGSVGDVVYLKPNWLVNEKGLAQFEFEPINFKGFRAKVTSSSSASADHTIVELDADGNVVEGGWEITDAQSWNGRKGIPAETEVFACLLGPTEGADPVCRFTLGEGQTGTPKDLTSTATTAESTEWDVEDQGDTKGVQFNPGRAAFGSNTAYFFNRIVTTDASGDNIVVSGETPFTIEASPDNASVSGWITMLPKAGGGDGGFLYHNGPGTDFYTFTLNLTGGTGIRVEDSTGATDASFTFSVDQLGHVTTTSNITETATIIATGGGGSADGQGYEDVKLEGVSVLAKTDGGGLDFRDTSSSGTTLGVNFNVTDADPDAQITGTVDASGLSVGDLSGGAGSELAVDTWVRQASTATNGDRVVLDAGDWRGRLIRLRYASFNGTVANANASTGWGGATNVVHRVGSGISTKEQIDAVGDMPIYVDGTDGGKLTGEVSVGSQEYQYHIVAIGSEQKSAADTTLS